MQSLYKEDKWIFPAHLNLLVMLDSFSLKPLKSIQHRKPCASWKKHNSKESHIQEIQNTKWNIQQSVGRFFNGLLF